MNHFRFFLLLLILNSSATIKAQLKGQLLIDSMLTELPHQNEDTNKVKLLRNIAYVNYRINKPDSTIKYAGMQLELANRLEWQKGVAYGNRMMGLGYEGRNELRKSIPYYENALKIFEQTDVQKAAEGVFELGALYYTINDNATAIQCFFRGLRMCRKAGLCGYEARCNTGIAVVYGVAKNYDSAVEHHVRAMKIAEQCSEIDSAELVGVYSNVAVTYQYKGDCASSLPYCFKTIELARQTGEKEEIANMYGNICLNYTKLRDYQKAIDFGRKALTFSDSIHDARHVAWSLYELGHAYLSYVIDTTPAAEGQKMAMGNIGPADKEVELRIALNYLEHAVDSARRLATETDLTKKIYEDLSKLYRLTGNWEKALKAYDMFITLKDSLFSKETDKQLMAQQMKYDFEKKEATTQAQQEKKDIQQRNIRNSTLAGMAALLIFSLVVIGQRNKVRKEKAKVEAEKGKSEALLLNILPHEVAEELKTKGVTTARHYDNITVLFTDFVSFTQAAEKMSPQGLIDELHTCFKAFDEITSKYNVEKIKTIGDAYLAVCGLPTPDPKHAENIVRAALEINTFMASRLAHLGSERTFAIRIGVHSGSVVAGIVGVKKFAYDIWGDTVNTAARIEQHGAAGKINISQATYELVKDKFNCEYRGEVEAKGKGGMKMYFVQ